MPDTAGTIIVSRPMDEVFAFVANLENIPLWDRSIERVDLFGPVTLGTSGRLVGRDVVGLGPRGPGDVLFEVVEYEPPRRLAIRSSERGLESKLTWTLEPVAGLPDITRLTAEIDVTGRGLLRMAESAFKLLTPKDSSGKLAKLKELIESSARDPATRPSENGTNPVAPAP